LSIGSQSPSGDLDSLQETFRSIKIEGEELEFSKGFTNLHTESYARILDNNGFGIKDARNSIQIAHDIRHKKPIGLQGEYHPLALVLQLPHPFSHNSPQW
jgi:UDP-N-acetyl-2-amino-2-deoxyglucuronate dehydrogenase